MYAILLSLLAGLGTGFALGFTEAARPGWAVFWGVAAFAVVVALVSLFVRRRVGSISKAMQERMLEGQRALQARVNDFQNHPKGDPRRFLEQMQKRQADLVDAAIADTEALEPYRRWVPWFGRQIATMRMQLNYQVKRFGKVDALLPRCLILDPLTAAMKMARQFATNAELPEIEKTYRRARARLRYDQSAYLSSVMAWMYVRRNKLDEAYALLEKACKDNNTEKEPNASLVRNRDALANNRVKQFTLSSFGDQWYGLFLEEPRIRYERRAPTRFGKFG